MSDDVVFGFLNGAIPGRAVGLVERPHVELQEAGGVAAHPPIDRRHLPTDLVVPEKRAVRDDDTNAPGAKPALPADTSLNII